MTMIVSKLHGSRVTTVDDRFRFADPDAHTAHPGIKRLHDTGRGSGQTLELQGLLEGRPRDTVARAFDKATRTNDYVSSLLRTDRGAVAQKPRPQLETYIPCFTLGTMIATARGAVPVEDLKEGDRVVTRDNGLRPVVWIGRRDLSASELAADPKLRPISIKAGSLGCASPERDLLVSPSHRVLIRNPATRRLFGESEILSAAKYLTRLSGIRAVKPSCVSYFHVMFESHEVIQSDGLWTESFQPSDQTLGAFTQMQRDEVYQIFPELRCARGRALYSAARYAVTGLEATYIEF